MKGFTLIELLLVMGIALLLLMVSIPLFNNLQISSQLNESTSQLIQTLRTAQSRSISRLYNETHGVGFQTDSYTLYQSFVGSDYDRVVNLDGVLNLSWNLSGGTSTISFSKTFGIPSATGTITLTHGVSGIRGITINSSGLIDEE